MSLSAGKAQFKSTLKSKLSELSDNENSNKTPEEAIEEFAEFISNELEIWIKKAKITAPVNTQVTGASATGGPVTGNGVGNITAEIE